MSGDAPGSEIPTSAAYRVNLPQFEGPLDLLLHLCQTHEIDIVNLPVSFITARYLEYLDLMQSISVEVAAEYLVMAATLCYLKSRELVPTPEPLETAGEEGADEALDPREELIRRLLEYQKYKDAAENLAGRPIEGKNVFGRGLPMEPAAEAGMAEHSVWKLVESWAKLLEKATPKLKHEVEVDRVSISDRINQLVDRLQKGGGSFAFEAIVDLSLPDLELRHHVVVTLLAILELAKLRVIRVLQDAATGEFFVSQREGAALDEARKLVVTSAGGADAAPEGDSAAHEDGAAEGGPVTLPASIDEGPSDTLQSASDALDAAVVAAEQAADQTETTEEPDGPTQEERPGS